MAYRLPVALAVPLNLFVHQDGPVVKPKVPSLVDVPAKLDPRHGPALPAPYQLHLGVWRFCIEVQGAFRKEILIVRPEPGGHTDVAPHFRKNRVQCRAHIAQVFIRMVEPLNVTPSMVVPDGGINRLVVVPAIEQVFFGGPLCGVGAIDVPGGIVHHLRPPSLRHGTGTA